MTWACSWTWAGRPPPRTPERPLSGPAANALTRGYHLYSMSGNRMRVLADWAMNATTPAEPTSLAVISAESVPLNVEKPRA